MSDYIIKVENLSKSYQIKHHHAERYTALRDVITNNVKHMGSRLLGRRNGHGPTQETFWALNDVSFEVKPGERVGIIGRNGAGKSTLLKILSRITEPTAGRVRLRGRIASLLEVGTGFHPELTGRENIFLNGAILGMTREEIKRKFDEIVAFAEVEKFLDTPVKRYSSGMYVRLAFAVAAHLEPEILVVDEVLAVGDAAFQKKCLGKMGEVASEGRTVLFVSHNMAAIQSLCSKAVLLDKGKIVTGGLVDDCVNEYENRMSQGLDHKWINKSVDPATGLVIREVHAYLSGTQPHLYLSLYIVLESYSVHKPAFLAIDILNAAGIAIMQAIPKLEGFIVHTSRKHSIKTCIQLPPLIPGQYQLTLWVGSHNTETLHEAKGIAMFEVSTSPLVGRTFPHHKEHGYIVPVSTVEYYADPIA